MSTATRLRKAAGTVLSGICGLMAGVALALLWRCVTLIILVSPYNGFWGDVYAVIIDCCVGAVLGTLGGICISFYCPRERRLRLLFGLTSVILSVPAIVWDASSFPHRIVVDGSALSFIPFNNQVWYLLLWGLPALGVAMGFLCRRTWLGRAGMGLAAALVAYGFLPR